MWEVAKLFHFRNFIPAGGETPEEKMLFHAQLASNDFACGEDRASGEFTAEPVHRFGGGGNFLSREAPARPDFTPVLFRAI